MVRLDGRVKRMKEIFEQLAGGMGNRGLTGFETIGKE